MNARRAALLPTVLIASALLSGGMWAGFTYFTGKYAGIMALPVGFLCGLAALLISGSSRPWAQWGAVVAALLGLALGKYFDVVWNFVPEVARQLQASQPGLTQEAAEQIARLQREGASFWELLRQRLVWYDGLSWLVGLYLAFRVASSEMVAQWFSEAEEDG